MFEAKVAQFYRSKGYEVHEKPRVRGASDNIYTVAMVADGPLGALLISFGDAGGIDAPEIGRVRTMARDIGATPVVASPTLGPDLRRLAAQMAVVVLDEATVTESGPLPKDLPGVAADPLRRDMDAHPWPASGRAFSYAGPNVAAARDVDELVRALHAPTPKMPALPSLLSPAPSASVSSAPPPSNPSAQTLVAPETPPQVMVPPVAPAARFAWLGGEASLVGMPSQAGPVDLGSLLGAKPQAMTEHPAVEHEASLLAKTPPLQKAQQVAGGWLDAARDWPWKTIVWTSVGATLLVLFIRWLT